MPSLLATYSAAVTTDRLRAEDYLAHEMVARERYHTTHRRPVPADSAGPSGTDAAALVQQFRRLGVMDLVDAGPLELYVLERELGSARTGS